MKIVVDMILSPTRCAYPDGGDHDTMHWSHIREMAGTDETMMRWAPDNDCIVLIRIAL